MKSLFPAKIFIAIGLLIILLLAFVSAVKAESEDYTAFSGTRFITNDSVEINSTVNNDLFAAGEKVTVQADVADNAFIAGYEVSTEGIINNNAFIIGSKVIINGPVTGDTFITGNYIVINGDILGDARIIGEQVHINGDIAGDASIGATSVFISERTTILGEENIEANKISREVTNPELTLENATDPDFSFVNFDESEVSKLTKSVGILLVFFSAISSLISGYFILKIFPVFSENAIATGMEKPMESIAAAAITFLIAALISIPLLLTFVGIELFSLLALLAGLVIMFGNTYGSYIAGRFVLKKLGKDKVGTFVTLLTGVILVEIGLGLAAFIPYLGLLVALVAWIIWAIGAGGMLYKKYQNLSSP